MEKKLVVMCLQKGLSQTEIAKQMGVHQPKVSEWLNGVRMPNSQSLHKLAIVLNEHPLDLALKLKQISQM